MSPQEQLILESLDALLQSDAVRAGLEPIVERVERDLARDEGAAMAWESIPLSIYGEGLPPLVRSSWVFILRAGATTGAERHPNSHQRMMSFRGTGDLQTGGEGQWQSNPLVSERDADLERRWASIPVNVWHQAVVSKSDWVVVSFHTVPAHELIEERPNPTAIGLTVQRRYVVPGDYAMPLVVRKVRLDDAEAILSILNPIIASGAYSALDTPFTLEAEQDFIRSFPVRGVFHVAEQSREQRMVGFQTVEPFASYTHAYDHVGVIATFVETAHRGRGVGRRLAEATFEQARRKGYEKLFTLVRADNPDALQFYSRLGFRVLGTAARQARIRGKYVDEVIIEKLI
jgi:L-amino acid N-acyltransferase YncA